MTGHQAIAVLITCHNRKEKTLNSLKSLYRASLPENFSFDVYLVDDGSTDGTGEAVKKMFPGVNVIPGTGNLYWNRGMRLAWETAAREKDYDFYLWLNDDTIIDTNAVTELLNGHGEADKLEKSGSIIVGTCRAGADSKIFSYGGRDKSGPVIPNGQIQKCRFINGNLVLVPRQIFKTIGNLSPLYTHGIGDNDYGLRAIEEGFSCYVSGKYIATCPKNEIPNWYNPKVSMINRFRNLYSPKGLNLKEYIIFLKQHKKGKWFIAIIKVYLKALFPCMYNSLSDRHKSQIM